jgi:predicted transposase/invertase (TIGR01784 family)
VTHPNPHDSFVKAVFSRPENAAGELKAVLPPALLAKLDLSSLEASPRSFVDERLTWRHSDLLLQARFAGRPALLYVLLEHQSTPDPLLTVRLAVYMGRIWDEWLREHEGERARVPAVIPLVLYHGSAGWTVATELLHAFDLDLTETELEAVRPHLPNFRFVLDDLVRQTDGDLRRREAAVLGRLALLLLKHLRRVRDDAAAFAEAMQTVADLIRLLPPGQDRVMVLSYIMEVVDPADPEAVTAALGSAATPEVLEDVMTAAEKLRKEGEARGEAKGRLAARRSDVTRLLRARFPGQVSEQLEERVRSADDATLEAWFERGLSATTLDDVITD